MTATNQDNKETVGGEYEITTYGVLSRMVGGDGKWYGVDNYKTLGEAEEKMRECLRGVRHEVINGVPKYAEVRYIRKLIKVVKHCEVLSVGIGPA